MKKVVFAFILGLITAGSIVGVVAYNYNAKDVSYTPSDSNWNVNNVEDAIKDLRNGNIDFNNLVVSKNISGGDRLSTRTASLNLDRGKYILFASYSMGATWTATGDETSGVKKWPIDIDTNECNEINGYSLAVNASRILYDNNKNYLETRYFTWYCNINTNKTVTLTVPSIEIADQTQIITAEAIKLK